MRMIQTTIEDTLSRNQSHTDELRTATRTAASAYADLIRKQYLRSISLDDIRKLAPGARMQPLRDLGVTSLLDCYSWGAANFARLRGIGPDSANRLAAACAALTKSANQQPIIHPDCSDAGGAGNDLFQCIFRQRQSHELLMPARAALQSVHDTLRPQLEEVQSATSFLRWLFGSEKKHPLSAAIDTGKMIETKASAGAEIAVVIDEAKEKLGTARTAMRTDRFDERSSRRRRELSGYLRTIFYRIARSGHVRFDGRTGHEASNQSCHRAHFHSDRWWNPSIIPDPTAKRI
jgi:hypothetical protein